MGFRKTATLVATLSVLAVPAGASAQFGPPQTTPPGYDATNNPGSAHVPTREDARAIGRVECQEFKRNFADNRAQFGKCVAAAARVVRTDTTPRSACAGLNRKPQEGERRSDFSACVEAAARAQRQVS